LRTDDAKGRGKWKNKEVDEEREETGGREVGGNEEILYALLWDLIVFFVIFFSSFPYHPLTFSLFLSLYSFFSFLFHTS
jgi:hypothetical protein